MFWSLNDDIADNMNPDQTALRSSLIRIHSVFFHDQKQSKVHLNKCSHAHPESFAEGVQL